MKKITKRDYAVLQVVLAELARKKRVGLDDGCFRGMSIETYVTFPVGSDNVTACGVTIPGWNDDPFNVVLHKQGEVWIATEMQVGDGPVCMHPVTYNEDGHVVLGEARLNI